jgi:GGDEF domain-containing protein
LDRAGLAYQLFPLRRSARTRHTPGLLAVRRSTGSVSPDAEPWSELARAIVEADFAASETLNDERQRSRRLLATLRFLRHLVETDGEGELAQALVQAAAVWFDVDARIYQRDLAGDFLLHTALPGAPIDQTAKRLNSMWIAGAGEMRRLGSVPEWSHGPAGHEVILVPLAGSSPSDWILALVGSVGEDAESLFPILGRIAGLQLEAVRTRRAERTRDRFESLVRQTDIVPDLQVVHIVRELVALTGAGGAALTLNRHGLLRRLVCIGALAPEPVALAAASGESLFAADQFVCALPLAPGVSATLEMRPANNELFSPDAALVTGVAARVLQTWLVGAAPLFADQTIVLDVPPQPAISAFLRRIEEELERAKRFDLRLSLVLIDVPRQPLSAEDAVALLQETVRRELRGSDVLGKMNGQRVAALLTHTDAPGSHRVVGRLRRRLTDAASRLHLVGVTVGHAVFSSDCRTAEALVSQAVRDAAPIGALN